MSNPYKPFLLGIFIFLSMAFSQPRPLPPVFTVSAMRHVMKGEDLSSHIYWDSLPQKYLYALAPLGRIEGELTVIKGRFFVSTVDSQHRVRIEQHACVHSPFAVYAYIKKWAVFEVQTPVNSEAELQLLIEKTALDNGYSLDKPFAFRVVGVFDSLSYHIISKPKEEREHNHDLHTQAKKHFKVSRCKGELLGFYSKQHEGIFTHKGQFTHIHFIDDKRKNMGHLEGITSTKKIKIYLPKA
jgi:acetolactate decarboxylase